MLSNIVVLGSRQSTHVFADTCSNSYLYTSCLNVLLLLLLLVVVVVVAVAVAVAAVVVVIITITTTTTTTTTQSVIC
jgi:hypothetical protein